MEAIYWLIALAVLLVIEIITLGLTTIWFAGGTLVAFFASLLGFSMAMQVILFFAVSLVLLFFTRPIAVKYINQRTVKTNYEGLIGQEAKVVERIDNDNSTGTASLNGMEWMARAADENEVFEVGTQVKIVNIVGVKLIVEIEREEI